MNAVPLQTTTDLTADGDRLGHHCGRPIHGLARRIAEHQGHRALVHSMFRNAGMREDRVLSRN